MCLHVVVVVVVVAAAAAAGVVVVVVVVDVTQLRWPNHQAIQSGVLFG